MKHFLVIVAILAGAITLSGQTIQVNRQNKTIAVTADDSATAEAEIAVLTFGYHNYGLNHDAAFRENVRAADKITKALLDAKIPKDSIETDKLSLSRTRIDEQWTDEMKRERQFTAAQSWHVTVSASEAQVVVDLAVKAGANEVDDVTWNVVDPVALQAKAGSAALSKARTIAEQMAKGLGAKLGELVYASNRAAEDNELLLWAHKAALPPPPPPPPSLTLFPQKVKSDATVYAVFAIE